MYGDFVTRFGRDRIFYDQKSNRWRCETEWRDRHLCLEFSDVNKSAVFSAPTLYGFNKTSNTLLDYSSRRTKIQYGRHFSIFLLYDSMASFCLDLELGICTFSFVSSFKLRLRFKLLMYSHFYLNYAHNFAYMKPRMEIWKKYAISSHNNSPSLSIQSKLQRGCPLIMWFLAY